MDHDIFHITHVDNLPSILEEGRLWADSERIKRKLASTNIGYSHIKARRLKRPVKVAKGGTLGDYVPFNFCSRSIMLYVVARGHTDYASGQDAVVHLRSTISGVVQSERPFFFTDRHADLDFAEQLESLDDLEKVDWDVMPVEQWGGNDDLKERRQAEFLIYRWFPWTAIEEIATMTQGTASVVHDLLADCAHQPEVQVRPQWYYY